MGIATTRTGWLTISWHPSVRPASRGSRAPGHPRSARDRALHHTPPYLPASLACERFALTARTTRGFWRSYSRRVWKSSLQQNIQGSEAARRSSSGNPAARGVGSVALWSPLSRDRVPTLYSSNEAKISLELAPLQERTNRFVVVADVASLTRWLTMDWCRPRSSLRPAKPSSRRRSQVPGTRHGSSVRTAASVPRLRRTFGDRNSYRRRVLIRAGLPSSAL